MGQSAERFEKLAQDAVTDDVPGIDLAVFRAMFGLSRATPRLIADFESAVQRPHGLSWAGFRLLFCLQVSGPLQTGELARLLFTTAPTVSSVVNTLEARRLVRRERLDRDRRLVEVHLTPAGDRLILTGNRREPGFRATNGEIVTVSRVDDAGRQRNRGQIIGGQLPPIRQRRPEIGPQGENTALSPTRPRETSG